MLGAAIVVFIFLVLALSPCVAQEYSYLPQQNAAPRMNAGQNIALQGEDEAMFSQMRRISVELDQFCSLNRRFPEQGDEMRYEKDQMNQMVPNNPYTTGGLNVSPGLDAEPSYINPEAEPVDFAPPADQNGRLNRIHLRIDGSLTELDVQQWLTNPPEDMTGTPGDIYCLSNQQNFYVIWGVGRNGRPLRDPFTGHTRLIIGRYQLLNEQD